MCGICQLALESKKKKKKDLFWESSSEVNKRGKLANSQGGVFCSWILRPVQFTSMKLFPQLVNCRWRAGGIYTEGR